MPYAAPHGPISLTGAMASLATRLAGQGAMSVAHATPAAAYVGDHSDGQPSALGGSSEKSVSLPFAVKLKVLAAESFPSLSFSSASQPSAVHNGRAFQGMSDSDATATSSSGMHEGQDKLLLRQEEDLLGRRRKLSSPPFEAQFSSGEVALLSSLSGGKISLVRKGGSDCVLSARPCTAVPVGCIALSEVQRLNLRMAEHEFYEFELFTPQPADDLTDVCFEVRLLQQHEAEGAGGESDLRAASDERQQKASSEEQQLKAASQGQQLKAASQGQQLKATNEEQQLRLQRKQLQRELLRRFLGQMVAVSQLFVLQVEGVEFVLRAAETNVLDEEERQEAVVYHCFRGRLTPATDITFTSSDPRVLLHPPSQHQKQPELLTSSTSSTSSAPSSAVDVFTSDGEWFPVKRKLLRPCIALTKIVRTQDLLPYPVAAASAAAGGRGLEESAPAAELPTGHLEEEEEEEEKAGGMNPPRFELETLAAYGPPAPPAPPAPRREHEEVAGSNPDSSASPSSSSSIHLDIDCLTFDRVLRFLEADWLQRGSEFKFDINGVPAMLDAAQKLGLRSLESICLQKMGEFEGRIRQYSFDEIKAKNASGECWIIIDGMVFDVTHWLSEHPGGDQIIPNQALNFDCARFFELYHSSRESFLYLKHFYMGDIIEADCDKVLRGEKASEDFLEQLNGFCTFRLRVQQFKSF